MTYMRGLKWQVIMKNSYVVVCYSKDGKLVKIYPSAAKASRSRHLYKRSIEKAIRENIPLVKGYQWRRYLINEVPTTIDGIKEESKKLILQYSFSGKLLSSYISVIEASKKTKINKQSIYNAIKGKARSAGNCYWLIDEEKKSSKLDELMRQNKSSYKEVIQLDKSHQIIKKYPSVKLASLSTKINEKNITQAIRRKGKAIGYYWVGKK